MNVCTPNSVPETPDEMIGREDLASPGSPGSEDSSEASTPLDPPIITNPKEIPKRVPSLRSVSDPPSMHPSSTPLGTLASARRPPASVMSGPLANSDLMLKAKTLAEQRRVKPPSLESSGQASPITGAMSSGFAGNFRLQGSLTRPGPPIPAHSAPAVTRPGGLAGRRGLKMNLGAATPTSSPQAGAKGPSAPNQSSRSNQGSKMDDFKKYIDAEKGWITFEGAATITRTGVNFASGHTFQISLDEIEPLGELGKGNYGTVYKVRHAKPRIPRFGPGMAGFKRSAVSMSRSDPSPVRKGEDDDSSPLSPVSANDNTTGVVMAMKEIRLELDEAKFTTILKELVILHECISPYIIDFYGAFFQEGAVYMCIEYMDGGSIDKLYSGGIPEDVLRTITYSTIMGLKTLKDEHNIIHRDVKPTNILVNSRGQVKICDFGVSGNLVASIAKTNIGCQSYMAPERISGGGMAQPGASDGTYSVQSDIWSLGLTIIECAMGKYPYPPEISSTIFSQLSAIVEGEPPNLPENGYSVGAREFVRSCLNKVAKARPTYAMLLNHPWMAPLSKPETITEEDEDEVDGVADGVNQLELDSVDGDKRVAEWVRGILERRLAGVTETDVKTPALHAAPLDTVSPMSSPMPGAGPQPV